MRAAQFHFPRRRTLRWLLASAGGLGLFGCGGGDEPRDHEGDESAAAALRADRPLEFQLVAARDGISGNFPNWGAVSADRERIYMASYEGRLLVLARDASAGFPLLQVLHDTAWPLTSVRSDRTHVYVTSADGHLRVYLKQSSLALVAAAQLSTYGLSALALDGDDVFVSKGQAYLAVDHAHVHVGTLNPGDLALRLHRADLSVRQTYGEPFQRIETQVLERKAGARVAGLPFARLYANGKVLVLMQFLDGVSWGSGFDLYDPRSLAYERFLPLQHARTATALRHWLVAFGGSGSIGLFDLRRPARPLVAGASLHALIRRPELSSSLDLRAAWSDSHDDHVFVANSSGGENLPALYVIKVLESC